MPTNLPNEYGDWRVIATTEDGQEYFVDFYYEGFAQHLADLVEKHGGDATVVQLVD